MAAIEVAVVALPSALRHTALLGYTSIHRGRDLVPNTKVGIRRVLAIYSGMTAACVMGYLAVGVELVEAVVIGLGTVSTGGFSPRSDSMAGYGTGAMVVATVGMLFAGFSIFVLWWMLHGRARPLLKSQELRTYMLLVALLAAVLAVGGDADPGEALFTAASVASTTGYAVSDWTVWPAAATTALLVSAAIGSMLGSAGGGLQILRIRLLLGYARRELQRQLRPRAMLVVRREGRAVSEATLKQVSSYQIANLTLVTFGAIVLGITGLSITGSLWASVSALSTLGPAVGEIGAFGSLDNLNRTNRAALMPLMLAGRVAILPLLVVLGSVVQWHRFALRRARWLGWRTFRHFEGSRYYRVSRYRSRPDASRHEDHTHARLEADQHG